MRLLRFWAERLPGIAGAFDFEAGEGVNLLTGPNGIGKSSVARALHRLVWPRRQAPAPRLEVRAEFLVGGRTLQAEYRGGAIVAWTEAGVPVAPPQLPPDHLAGCHHLDLLDMMPAVLHGDDAALARELTREMSGGVDVARVQEALFPLKAPGHREKRKELDAAEELVRKLRDRQERLHQQERSLDPLRHDLERARLAGQRAEILQKLRRRSALAAELAVLQRERGALPPGAGRVRDEDPQTLQLRRAGLARGQAALVQVDQELQRLRAELQELVGAGAGEDPTVPLAPIRQRLKELRTLQSERAAATRACTEARRNLALAEQDLPPGDGAGEPAEIGREQITRLADLGRRLNEHRFRALGYRSQLDAGRPGSSAWAAILPAAGAVLAVGAACLAVLVPGWQVAWAGCGLGLGMLVVGLVLRAGLSGRREIEILLRNEQQAEDRLAAELQELAAELGLKVDPREATPAVLAEAARAAGQARREVRTRQTACDLLDRQGRELLAKINGGLEDLGAPAAGDLDAAEATVAAVEHRWQRKATLEKQIATAEARAAEHRNTVAQAEQEIAAVVGRLDLDPDLDPETAAGDLLRTRPRFEDLGHRIESLGRENDLLERDIAAGLPLFGDEDVADLAAAELEARIERETDLAADRDRLSAELGRIEGQVADQRRGHDLQDALDRSARAREALAEERDAQIFNRLGAFLLERAQQEHRDRTQPAVLREADRLLQRITGHRYSLRHLPGSDGGSGFAALDLESRQTVPLGALSAGTRVQLLLAVRLAFLGRTGGAAAPPLILDDTLASFDPERFAATVQSLGRLAAAQRRQMLVLCPRSGEAAAWDRILTAAGLPPAHPIDLADRRGRAAAAGEATLGLWSPSPPALPDLALGPQRYARELGVPRIDPWAEPESLPLFYLLSDHLDRLASLLTAGTPTLGRWLAGHRDLERAGLVDDAFAALIETRSQVWRSFLRHWRIGRSRPLTRAFLEDSQAVTARKLEEVDRLRKDLGGDGRALLAALRDRQVERFQSDRITRLQEEMMEAGLLDGAEPLDRDRIVQAVLHDTAELVAAGALATETIHRLVDRFSSALESPGAKGLSPRSS